LDKLIQNRQASQRKDTEKLLRKSSNASNSQGMLSSSLIKKEVPPLFTYFQGKRITDYETTYENVSKDLLHLLSRLTVDHCQYFLRNLSMGKNITSVSEDNEETLQLNNKVCKSSTLKSLNELRSKLNLPFNTDPIDDLIKLVD